MEVRQLELDALDLSLGRLRRLPKGDVQRMAASLRSKGQLSPIVVARLDERWVLVDGFVRTLAARQLGLEHLVAEVVEVTSAQMKAQIYLRNRERGLHLLEESRLVRELVEVDGLSQVEVGDHVERHKSWVCRRLALARRLSPSLVDEPELGRLTAGSLSQLAQLPMRNQEQVWATAQRDAIEGGQVGLLARLWRQAPDPDARAWVLAHPAEALARARGATEESSDPRLGPAGDELHRGLVVLRRVSLRLTRRVQQGLGALDPEGLAVLARAHQQARADCTDALQRVHHALGASDA
jgi:ParB/RepB/Spo0J family partition protein